MQIKMKIFHTNTNSEVVEVRLKHISACLEIEPEHDKNNKKTCAPSKDADQPTHSCSLNQSLRCALYGYLLANDPRFRHQ